MLTFANQLIRMQAQYRWIVKQTFRMIKSSHFRAFIVNIYRRNADNTQITPQITDAWLTLISDIVQQQQLKVINPPVSNHLLQICLLSYPGFIFDQSKFSSQNQALLRQMLNLFMKVQLLYMNKQARLKLKQKFAVIPIISGCHYTQLPIYCSKISEHTIESMGVKIFI